MKFTAIAIFLSATFISGAAYFYFQNQNLQAQLLAASEHCKQQTADLQTRYQHKIDTLLTRLPADNEVRRTVTATIEQKPALDNLVSYGHKVRAVTHKYEFILETAQIDEGDKKRLRRLLLEREQLAGQLEQQQSDADSSELEAKLASVEKNIEDLLKDPVDYTRYEYLKQRSL